MNIKQLRLDKEMTQMEVARLCEVSLYTFQKWEKQVAKPSKENLIKLKKVLGVDKNNK